MSPPNAVADRAEALDAQTLLALVEGQRWFAAKGREAVEARVCGVHYADDAYALALAEIRFREGTHETYLLPLAWDGDRPYDAFEDRELVERLGRLAGVRGLEARDVQPMGVEQSNTSVVVDARYAMKLYRKLEPGPSPELEMLRVLRAKGFAHAPPLEGAIEHVGPPLDAALVVVTGFVESHGDGWSLALDGLAGDDPEWLPARARRLGEVTGAMHTALGSVDDSAFAPEDPSAEAVALLAASVEEEIDGLFLDLPSIEELQPIAGRSGDLRDLVGMLGSIGPAGRFTRIHGDYHLGQVLWSTRDDWVVIDFEGEPGRSLPERRQRNSPLRDVAGMLRSFSYAEDGAELLRDVRAPDGWAQRCRAAFLEGYREALDPALLPPSEAGGERLLALFELQKLVYELRYDLNNRPPWARIPVAGLLRLLEQQV